MKESGKDKGRKKRGREGTKEGGERRKKGREEVREGKKN